MIEYLLAVLLRWKVVLNFTIAEVQLSARISALFAT